MGQGWGLGTTTSFSHLYTISLLYNRKAAGFCYTARRAEALDRITGPLLYFNAFFSWISNRKCYSNQLSPHMYVDRVHNVGVGWLGEVWGKGGGGCRG